MIKLICGKSRAGKTTYSQRFEDVIHLDNCGGLTTCYDNALLKVEAREGDVVIEGIYNTRDRRMALLNAYRGDGPRVCVWLNTPEDVLKKRMFNPKAGVHPKTFEPPSYEEGWDEIIVKG